MEIFRHSNSAFVRPKRVNWIRGTHTQTYRHTDRQTDLYIELRYAQLNIYRSLEQILIAIVKADFQNLTQSHGDIFV